MKRGKRKVLILGSFSQCDAIWGGGWAVLRVHSTLPCLTERETEAQTYQTVWLLAQSSIKPLDGWFVFCLYCQAALHILHFRGTKNLIISE